MFHSSFRTNLALRSVYPVTNMDIHLGVGNFNPVFADIASMAKLRSLLVFLRDVLD